MSKMKKNRKKLFAILLQAALVSTAMTMPAYAAKTPGIGSDALVGDDATGPVLTGGNTEVEEETSPYTKEQLEDGTLEYGEIAWRIEGYNSTYLNLRSQLYSQTTSQSAGTALAAEASALMEDAMDLKSDDMDAETRELFEGYKAAARELRKQGAKLTNKELSGTYARTLRQTKNKLVKAVQNLLIQYEELLPQVETAKKNVEMCQVNADAAQKMQALGRASAQEVLTAQKALQQANSSAQQAENGALQLKQNILMLLGFGADAPVTFADVPVPDASRIAAMDLGTDTQAADGYCPERVLSAVVRQGFVKAPESPEDAPLYLVDMHAPLVLVQNLETTLKEPFSSNPRVLDAIYKAHRELQMAMTRFYPGQLVLSMSASVIYHRLVERITALNGVPRDPVTPRHLGGAMCVPFGKILRNQQKKYIFQMLCVFLHSSPYSDLHFFDQ